MEQCSDDETIGVFKHNVRLSHGASCSDLPTQWKAESPSSLRMDWNTVLTFRLEGFLWMSWLKWRTLWRSQSSIKEFCLPNTMLGMNGMLKNCSTCCVVNLERIAGFYETRFGDPRPAFKGLFLTGHERAVFIIYTMMNSNSDKS